MNEKKLERFQRELLQLEPIEFMGIAKILGVELFRKNEEGKEEPIPFEEIYAAVVSKYATLSRFQRRNLNRLLRPVVRELSK